MSNGTINEFEVLKFVTAQESTKVPGELIFRDDTGRIYFLDKKFKSELDMEAEERYLAWVTKEADKVGYIVVDINGVELLDYIFAYIDMGIDKARILVGDRHTPIVKLSNYLHNNSRRMKMYKEVNNITEISEHAKLDITLGYLKYAYSDHVCMI